MGLWGRSLLGRLPIRTGVNPRYMDMLIGRLVQVVMDAARRPVAVDVRPARFDVPGDWFRNDRKGGGKDDFGQVLAFDGAGGRVATLVNFAAHPETLWEGATLISADYPGAVRRRLKSLVGGQPVFFSGALGGMVTPNIPEKMRLEERKAAVDRLGTGIADLAEKALAQAPAIKDPALRARRLPLELPLDNRMFKVLKTLGVLQREFLFGRVRTEMQVVTLGKAVTLLTAPGECTPEVGREMMRRIPGDFRLLLGLGCDELGYILTPSQFMDKEWSYEQTMSVGPRTAPMLWEGAERLGKAQ